MLTLQYPNQLSIKDTLQDVIGEGPQDRHRAHPRRNLLSSVVNLCPSSNVYIKSSQEVIGRTTNERLQESLHEVNTYDLDALVERPLPVVEKEKTVLYLAYGSNLCYTTFQGKRGIRPISQINVVVPELRLTFDLPGVPYIEPCFANTARRDPSKYNLSQVGQPSLDLPDYHKDRWKKGLVGVVYEVTMSDFAIIIATEGGGSSYEDILVTCYPLQDDISVPDVPNTQPFKAHTLFVPSESKDTPLNINSGNNLHRPDPSYAQPSARYLKLITDGAKEHSLPHDYQAYLYDIRPYTITTKRQSLGKVLITGAWLPVMVIMLSLAFFFKDKQGKSPKWLVASFKAVRTVIWTTYDRVFVKLFGDGERTIEDNHRFIGHRCFDLEQGIIKL